MVISLSPLKWGFTHLVIEFLFSQDGNKGPLPLTTTGLAGGAALAASAFGVTWNGTDQSNGVRIARTGTGTFTVPVQSGATLGLVYYQVSTADVTPAGIGPWQFQLEAYATFPDLTVAISDNIDGPYIVGRLAAK